MLIHRVDQRLEILAPAKVNLFLEVLGRREDGFHEVETIMCPITLFDRLVFEPLDSNSFELRVHTPATSAGAALREASSKPSTSDSSAAQQELESEDPAWVLPPVKDNLVHRAVARVQQELGRARGCRIDLHKAIPAAAGLGGGSSDTAAAICGYLATCDRWNRDLATTICQQLGSDIPFFLGSHEGIGLAAARGRGEICDTIKGKPQLQFLVSHPPAGCPTALVYSKFQMANQPISMQPMLEACETEDCKNIGTLLHNALQLPSSHVTEWISRQLDLFHQCGATQTLVSGSGSSCFAIVEDESAMPCVQAAGHRVGLKRVFRAQAHYAASIEQQLEDCRFDD